MSTVVMRAIGVPRYGPPEVLTEVDVPLPSVGPGQVLVRVAAAGINPADAAIRQGQFKLFIRRPFPLVIGSDIAGTVHKIGAGATHFAVGEPVHGLLPLLDTGGYATYALIDEASLAPIPEGLSMHEAAAVPLAALTAYQALVERGALSAGQRVLITGASGGVGTFAVQIAKAVGARAVTLTSLGNIDLVKRLGADESFDYTDSGVLRRIEPVDVVLDCARSLSIVRATGLLKPGGTLISVVPFANPVAILWATLRRRRFRWVKVRPDGGALRRIDNWIAEGRITAVIERVYPSMQAATAHHRIESHRVRGKLVIDMLTL